MKYDSMLSDKIKKVSVIALAPKNLAFLNRKLVKNPKKTPMASDTNPSSTNWPRIVMGMYQTNSTDCKLRIVPKRMIDTMSLTTPSPKMQENNFGCLE